jgi:sialate O-acetylesterase
MGTDSSGRGRVRGHGNRNVSRRLASLLFAALTLTAHSAPAVVSLEPAVHGEGTAVPFASGMVLQQDMPVPVWGRADAGENVSVTFDGQTKNAVTGGDGAWRVVLDPLAAGGPHTMTIEGTNTIVLTDVLVGEVWVCAGQSNMVVRRPRTSEMAEFPQIRALAHSGRWNDRPSGMAWAFAKEIHAARGVPVGIINRAAGGTPIRVWLPPEVQDDPDPEVNAVVGDWDTFGEQFESQLGPVVGLAIRGVVYWQGEQDLKLARQDVGSVLHYFDLLPALVRAWRTAWDRSDLPFVLVQLPTGGGMRVDETVEELPDSPPDPDIAALMRRATFNGLSEPGTTLTVSVDVRGGTHPRDRGLFGQRLANNARAGAYGEGFVYSGPIYSSMAIESGGRVRLSFRTGTAAGLQAIGGPLQGFAISADGETFVWANAVIEGEEVVVWNDAVATPAVVRYAWARDPDWANLFNGDGLGAAPFSTETTPAP